jgi:hypothetical protein
MPRSPIRMLFADSIKIRLTKMLELRYGNAWSYVMFVEWNAEMQEISHFFNN